MLRLMRDQLKGDDVVGNINCDRAKAIKNVGCERMLRSGVVEEWRKQLGLNLRDEITYLDYYLLLWLTVCEIIIQLYSAAPRLLPTVRVSLCESLGHNTWLHNISSTCIKYPTLPIGTE